MSSHSRSAVFGILGPALVLYLMADVAAAGPGFGAAALATAIVVLLCVAWVSRLPHVPGHRRVGTLGLAACTAMLAALAPEGASFTLDIAAVMAKCALGILAVDLAATVPRDEMALLRRRRVAVRAVPIALGILAGAVALAAVLPAFQFLGTWWIAPHRLAHTADASLLAGVVLALVVRIARPLPYDSTEDRTANAWAILGLSLGLVTGVAAWLSATKEVPTWFTVMLEIVTASALLAGHASMLSPKRSVDPGRAAQHAVTAATVAAVLWSAATLTTGSAPDTWIVLVSALGAGALYRLIFRAVRFVWLPLRGRLIHAASTVHTDGTASVDDLAARVLRALRSAIGPGASPVLWTFEPDLEIQLDRAGLVHARDRAMPSALRERLIEEPQAVFSTLEVQGLAVRRPGLRALRNWMKDAGAFCVVTLSSNQDLEGAILIPAERRRRALLSEERDALAALAARLGPTLHLLLRERRNESRRMLLEGQLAAAESDVRLLEAELQRERPASAPSLPTPVIYSAASHVFHDRLRDLSREAGPVMIVMEDGQDPIPSLAATHSAARPRGPFVVIDCSIATPGVSEFDRLGNELRPGWLESASGGTLVLMHANALSKGAQAELARQMSSVDTHVYLTAFAAPRRAFADRNLALLVRERSLRMPTLRTRQNDLPSILLSAVDRICRRLGIGPRGVSDDALRALLAYPWPGNERELEASMLEAIKRAHGARIELGDLPATLRHDAPRTPLGALAATASRDLRVEDETSDN